MIRPEEGFPFSHSILLILICINLSGYVLTFTVLYKIIKDDSAPWRTFMATIFS